MNEIVVGLDTASNRFHFVSNVQIPDTAYTFDEPVEPMHIGWTVLAGGKPDDSRAVMYRNAKQLFEWLAEEGSKSGRPVHVFCEEPLALAKNGKTTRLLGLAAGAIWAAHVDYSIFWWWIDQSTWKKNVLGRGAPNRQYYSGQGADKRWIRDVVRDNPAWQQFVKDGNYEWAFEDQHDLYDAWCLKVYGVRALRSFGDNEAEFDPANRWET